MSSISPAAIRSAKDFPATLKKLKLERFYLSWSYLDIIAELPNLEVLKLMFNACRGEEWYPIVRGFTRLKLLLIEADDLEYWKATNDNFSVLERLVLRYCSYLKEIPIEFADIHSLQLIELNGVTPNSRHLLHDSTRTRIPRRQTHGCLYHKTIQVTQRGSESQTKYSRLQPKDEDEDGLDEDDEPGETLDLL